MSDVGVALMKRRGRRFREGILVAALPRWVFGGLEVEGRLEAQMWDTPYNCQKASQ